MEHKIYRMYTDIDSGHVGMLNPRNECINKSRRPYKKIEVHVSIY